MMTLHEEPMFGMIVHEALCNIALETFIWHPECNKVKFSRFSKSPFAIFGQDKSFGVSRKLTYLTSSQVDILEWVSKCFSFSILFLCLLGQKNK